MKWDSSTSAIPFTNGNLSLEQTLIASGIACFCGVDEAGRGPLAGPVVAAAVVFRDCPTLWNACDSKKLLPRARDEQFARITDQLPYAVGECDNAEIDRLNILQASLIAMARAVQKLTQTPDLILVDGNYRLKINIPSRAIIRGDARVAVIGAASIVAKVTRDRIMREYDEIFPAYGFARHFGYPTAEHRRKIRELGPCPIHRRTFRGICEYYSQIVSEAAR
jgi:ribonuclease HII